MDDFLKIRFALDNVHPPELGENARKAFDRLLDGEAPSGDSPDGIKYERLRRGPLHAQNEGPAAASRKA